MFTVLFLDTRTEPRLSVRPHSTQITKFVSRTDTCWPPTCTLSDIGIEPVPFGFISSSTCHTPEIDPTSALADTTATGSAPPGLAFNPPVTAGPITPRPYISTVTVELIGAGLKQVFCDPSLLKASGNGPGSES
jgi:hypothetical protein